MCTQSTVHHVHAHAHSDWSRHKHFWGHSDTLLYMYFQFTMTALSFSLNANRCPFNVHFILCHITSVIALGKAALQSFPTLRHVLHSLQSLRASQGLSMPKRRGIPPSAAPLRCPYSLENWQVNVWISVYSTYLQWSCIRKKSSINALSLPPGPSPFSAGLSEWCFPDFPYYVHLHGGKLRQIQNRGGSRLY